MNERNLDKKIRLKTEEKHDFSSLLTLVEVLRGEGGCPWDAEQTHKSIRNDIIEETYEVVEAIDNGDADLLREELGDVLFQVIFHSDISRDEGDFTIDEVIGEIVDKMILRHPHVFAEVNVKDSSEVLDNWEAIKKTEKDRKTVKESMNSVPKQLPSLMRARKIAKKASKDGYDFAKTPDDIIKLAEKLKTADGNEAEDILTEIIMNSVILGGDGCDLEKKLGERVNLFIKAYESKND